MLKDEYPLKNVKFWLGVQFLFLKTFKMSGSISSHMWLGGRGARNVESTQPSSVDIFFMTYFYTSVRGHGHSSPPLDPLLINIFYD